MPLSPRAIPSIEQLRQRDEASALEAAYGRDALTRALADAAAGLRLRLGASDGDAPNDSSGEQEQPGRDEEVAGWLVGDAARRLATALRPSLRPVVNATGVIVHTNLGRAPLGRAAIDAITHIATGYANLEYDLDVGGRGRRDVHAERLLCRLTGAEAALVVNNNAAATMLLLAGLARGREVVVSRGELVEIGGGFRVPDVMAQSGATLREVGTTNRTRVADYAAAVNEKTALILRVHPSNFRIEGFTERPTLASLVALGRDLGVPVAEDQGSGNLLRLDEVIDAAADHPLAGAHLDEPTVIDSLADGADVVCCSGDKLLGGPQAGLLLGRRAAMDPLRRHPLLRALRVDKLTYAALEATLIEYAAGRATRTIPVAAMLARPAADIRRRADALCAAVGPAATGTTGNAVVAPPQIRVVVEAGFSTIGGGSAPGSALPTWVVAVESAGADADTIARALREGNPPVIARIADHRVLLDLRTVLPEQEAALVHALREVGLRLAPAGSG